MATLRGISPILILGAIGTDRLRFLTISALCILLIACVNSTNTVSTSGTTVTIAGDSEWQIPSGFSVIPTPATLRDDATPNDRGPPPDLPDFSMRRELETAGEREAVLIIVWADGVSAQADPKEVLMSWTEDGIRLAEFDAVVVTERV